MKIKFTSLMFVALAAASVFGKAHVLFGFFQG
jgi:hypothetical protein